MIKKEYEKLLRLLEQTASTETFSLEEILKEAVDFFESLRKSYPLASKEEQEEMMAMMNHLHAKLQEISERTAKASGMTEEELQVFAENPSNFTPEQWQKVQNSRRKLYQSVRSFSSSVEEEEKTSSKTPPPKKKSPRKTKRDKWMKS